jgi:hypothetical protein
MNQLAENNAAEAAADKQATDDPNSLIRFQISRFNRRFFFFDRTIIKTHKANTFLNFCEKKQIFKLLNTQ